MKKSISVLLIALACAAAVALLPGRAAAQVPEIEAAKELRKQEKFARLIYKASLDGAARVIVGFKGDFRAEGTLNGSETAAQRRNIKAAQERFLNRHRSLRPEKVKKFDFIPFLAFEADAAALERMQADDLIDTIEEDELAQPTLAESTALVGATAAWSRGFSGSGYAIAVLDTGVDKTHPLLSDKIISEACYSSNYTDAASLCPGGVTESTAAGSGINCDSSVSGCAHGTHVAGIAAGRGSSMSGVARDANVIAIQVFSRITSTTACGDNPSPCALSYSSDQLKALERVRSLSGSVKIAAVNMSLGGGQYTESCDASQPSRKAAVDNLRSLGIATVVASGNDSYTNAMSAPACISTTVSVGSTDDGSHSTAPDSVSSFSNSSSLLTLLAPGRWITSSIPNSRYGIYSGTSMAAPHVAGAFAVLRHRKENATVTEMLNALTSTGLPVTDSRNNITKPRIRIDSALDALMQTQARRTPFDYDGDGRADSAVFRPSSSVWYVQNSANGSFYIQQFGLSSDLITPADFDGDGKTDLAVFRPSNGVWYWLRSSTGGFSSVQFGTAGDVPVPADYDGDGRADPAVYRPSTGTWWILRSGSNAAFSQQFGLAEDKPAVADFDGDGRADISVWRPSSGVWYRINSGNGQVFSYQFGLSGDRPVPADFDGDGKADITVFRPSNGVWYRLNSNGNTFSIFQFGLAEDRPTAADYDGDGRADVAVFRPSGGVWYIQRSMQGFAAYQFGIFEDTPAQNAFVR